MKLKSFMGLLAAERLKLGRSPIWLLVPVSPVIGLVIGMLTSLHDTAAAEQYVVLQSAVLTLHAMLLLPILTGIFASFVCRFEHGGGGWKSMLSLPVTRKGLYMAKFVTVAVLLAITQLLTMAALVLATYYHDIAGGVDWAIAWPSLLSGWVACLPLAALQLWASIGWSSFAAPLAINVAFTLPNILIVNSADYGPFYPWAQPALAMLSVSGGGMDFGAFTLPIENVLITIGGSFVVFLVGGLAHMQRKEI